MFKFLFKSKKFVKFIDREAEKISQLKPERLVPEEMAKTLGWPVWLCRLTCHMSFKDGKFEKNSDNTYRLKK